MGPGWGKQTILSWLVSYPQFTAHSLETFKVGEHISQITLHSAHDE